MSASDRLPLAKNEEKIYISEADNKKTRNERAAEALTTFLDISPHSLSKSKKKHLGTPNTVYSFASSVRP